RVSATSSLKTYSLVGQELFELSDGLGASEIVGGESDAEFLFKRGGDIDLVERVPSVHPIGREIVGHVGRPDAQYIRDDGLELFAVVGHQRHSWEVVSTILIQSGVTMLAFVKSSDHI